MKSIIKLLISIIALAVATNANTFYPPYYDQYANLYPDCVDNESSKIYSLDEPYLEPPVFPGGGPVQMSRYVYFATEVLNIKDESGDQLKGIVKVRTVIDRCGVPTLIRVVESLSLEHDAEAIRVVREFPIFKPAELDGTRVKVAITVPVYFTRTYAPKRKYSSPGDYYSPEPEYNPDTDPDMKYLYDDDYNSW